ncbi:penicillin acylase family protein [Flavobacteriaceae bacterium S356]|uniref:Penicillin acylase family protein n=1 Tax=Asprobacillus argus TaxID=3076534 RepID=A0ABU3LC70_9FLAO|nr:penicillin acylase family protein [Flavobacteriaceae bacterium S356]
MKILKKILKIVIVLIVIVSVSIWLYARTFYPVYDGEVVLDNISEKVTVYYDDSGVPHINAQNQKDAYTALGYVHAQDRLWQMELIRRIAPGRLSEIFGVKLIETDVFFSGLGIEENTDKVIAALDTNSEAYKYTMAYLEGINQFIEEGRTPLEYTLVGVEKQKFTIRDVYNVFGYMSFSFAMAHKTDPFLTGIKEKLGTAYLAELGIPIHKNTAILRNEKNPEMLGGVARAMNHIYESLPVSPFIGSNSWVIGANKTKSGRVLFANDPHIGFSQPSVWYQSHIKTPDYEIYGFNLALTPFALLGHNKDYAYGLTMFENDDVDLYFEQNNPENSNEYKTKDGYEKYRILEKTIKIKDRPDSTFQVKVSRHGPIMNTVMKGIDDPRPLAMQWIYTKLDNKILDVSYQLSHAKSLSEFKEGAKLLHAPGLNIMYGDAKDNIAWFASGKLYKYRDSLNRKLILDGASGDDEIVEYLDFEENPQAINPSWNYVYSANNQPDTIAGILYPGYYLPEDRGYRIQQLLENKDDWTREDVEEMIFDVTSPVVARNVQNLMNSFDPKDLNENEKKALTIITEWDGAYKKEMSAPTVYTRFIYEFLAGTFKDEMGDSFEDFMSTPAFMKKMIGTQAAKTTSIWWDDITTEDVEEKGDIVKKAFKNTVGFLENQLGASVDNWQWSKVASVEHGHALGQVPSLRGYFNVGPFAVDGGSEVINNQLFKLNDSGFYKVHAGPSTRRIVDFSDVENSVSILPTGQSGNVFSKHYDDQAEKYLKGEFVKMLLNQQEIEKSKNILSFIPKN